MRPTINNTIITPLTDLPVMPIAGACLAANPRMIEAVTTRAFYFVPTSATASQFWGWGTANGAWQQLATPNTLGGAARFGAGCALIVDASGPTPLGGGVANAWLFHPRTDAPFAELQFYNATADTWTQASQAGGAFNAGGLGGAALAAQWASDAALAHPCTSLNPTVSDDFIYISGNAATFFYRYTISTGTVAAMAAHGAAAGAGVAMAWLPQRQDRIYYNRGGATVTQEWYGIAGNAWNAIAHIPVGTTFTSGDAMDADALRDRMVIFSAGRLYDFDGVNITPRGTMYGADEALYVGKNIATAEAGGKKFVFIAKHSSREFQRALIVE